MTEERQPNTELREKALAKRIASLAPVAWQIDAALFEQQVEELVAAFAASIQEEARQDFQTFYDELHAFLNKFAPDRESDGMGSSVFLTAERRIELIAERAEAAEKQLAEARAERDELAAQVNHDCAFHDEMALTNQIHNRFCGENGEPCQVCRLKAERAGEDKK